MIQNKTQRWATNYARDLLCGTVYNAKDNILTESFRGSIANVLQIMFSSDTFEKTLTSGCASISENNEETKESFKLLNDAVEVATKKRFYICNHIFIIRNPTGIADAKQKSYRVNFGIECPAFRETSYGGFKINIQFEIALKNK